MNTKDYNTGKHKLDLILESASKLGYTIRFVSEKIPVVVLEKDGKERLIWGDILPLNTSVSARICKYKNLTKIVLSENGINTPQGFLIESRNNFEYEFNNLGLQFPVVVKPNDLSLGTDVFVELKTKADTKLVIDRVLQNNKNAVVEEFCPGEDHRILVLNNKVIAACRRIKPFVIGDGKRTLRQLIDEYNAVRSKKIKEDEEFTRKLTEQEISLDQIVDAKRQINIRGNANVSTGGMVEDVTDKISDYFKNIAINAVRIIGGKYLGVDLITNDISKNDGKYFITEVNGNPDFDIHLYPDFGKARDTRPYILSAIFDK